MAKPVLAGKTARLPRRVNNTLNSLDLITPIEPPVETGGPYVVRTSGDWIAGNTVTIQHDGEKSFGVEQGTVTISNNRRISLITESTPLTVVSWTDDLITVTVAGTDLAGKYLHVRDAQNNLIRFCGLLGRVIRTKRLQVGVNTVTPARLRLSPIFANIIKMITSLYWHSGGDGKLYWQGGFKKTALINIPAGTVCKGQLLVQGSTKDPKYSGTYAVRWQGDAEVAVNGAYNTVPVTGWASPGTVLFATFPNQNFVVWLRNNTGVTIADFCRELTAVRIDDFPGATNADKAAAALASWDAGVANRDHRMYSPDYIAMLKDDWNIRNLRIMDWSSVTRIRSDKWDKSVLPIESMFWGLTEDPNWCVPFEAQFALARGIDADSIWINIPVLADDDYLERLAALIEAEFSDELRAGKKLYIEKGNETWNMGSNYVLGSALCGARYYKNNPIIDVYWNGTNWSTTATIAPFTEFDIWSSMDCVEASVSSNPALTRSRMSMTGLTTVEGVTSFNLVVSPTNLTQIKSTGTMRCIVTGGAGKSTQGIRGTANAQGLMYRKLKEVMPADVYAGIVKHFCVSRQFAQVKDAYDFYVAKGHPAVIGHIDEVSVNPYWKVTSSYIYLSGAPEYFVTNAETAAASCLAGFNAEVAIYDNAIPINGQKSLMTCALMMDLPGYSWSGAGVKVSAYEGGSDQTVYPGTPASKGTPSLTDPSVFAFFTGAQGARVQRYWLWQCAALPNVTRVNQYVDGGFEGIFSVRKFFSVPNIGRDAAMQEIFGEV